MQSQMMELEARTRAEQNRIRSEIEAEKAKVLSSSQAEIAYIRDEAERKRHEMMRALGAAEQARAASERQGQQVLQREKDEWMAKEEELREEAANKKAELEDALRRVEDRQKQTVDEARRVNAVLSRRLDRANKLHEAAMHELLASAEGFKLAATLRNRLHSQEAKLVQERRRNDALERMLRR